MRLEDDFADTEDGDFIDELKPGTKLMHGQYTIEGFLAAGGFGITYLAKDSLGRPIVIKECFPGSFCRRQGASVTPRSRAHQNELKSIVRLFANEAKSLAKAKHPNIVGVHQIFEENNTAYMALDFVRGRDLLELLQDEPESLTPARVEGYLVKMLDAIKHVHELGMLHRDISPDNIIINEYGEPILIDFGAARESSNERVTRMLSALRVVKDGYSPQEFYIAGSEQTPSCDLYSLAASFYHIATLELPPDSQQRLSARAAGEPDPYVSIGEKVEGYSARFVSGLDKAMSVLPKDRMQDADEWLAHLHRPKPTARTRSLASVAAAAAATVAPLEAHAKASKPMLPVLLGGTAAAAIAAGAFFFMSGPGADTTVAEAAPVIESVEAPREVAAAPEPDDATQPAIDDEIGKAGLVIAVNTPENAGETGAGESIVDSRSPRPDLRPVPHLVAVTQIAAVLPSIDTAAPAPAEPVVAATPEAVAEAEAQKVTAAAASAEGAARTSEMLDFFMAMRPEETRPARPAPADTPVVTASVDRATATAAEPATGPAIEFAAPAAAPTQSSIAIDAPEETADTPVETAAAPADTVAAPRPVLGAGTSAIISRTIAKLPFTLSDSEPGLISEVSENGPARFSENTRIVSINGTPMTSNAEIVSTVQALGDAAPGGNFDLRIGFEMGTSGAAFESITTVKKEHHLMLLNGLRFVSRQNGTRWITEVADAPASSNFRPGDVLTTYVATYEDLDGPETLKAILERELSGGASTFNFAIRRDGDTYIEAFSLAALDR